MRVFIVHAHPEPKSFNGALTCHAERVLRTHQHDVRISDLYALGFDPVSDRRNFTTTADPECFKQQQEEMHAAEHDGFAAEIQAELEKLDWCDALVLQFPLWWLGLPAILKGWVDRVFAMGRVYGGGRWYSSGVFAGKRAMVSLTTGGPATMYTAGGLNGSIEDVLRPIHQGIFRFTGFVVLPPFVAWGPARASAEQREAWLEEYGRRLLAIETTEPLRLPSPEEFDTKTFGRKE